MPRPTKLDPVREKAAIDAVRLGATNRLAAARAGVDETTFSRWQGRNAGFAAAIAGARADAEMLAVGVVRQAMIGGVLLSRRTVISKDGVRTTDEVYSQPDTQAAEWYLERVFPKDYGRVDRIELELNARIATLAIELGLDPDALRAEAQRIALGDISQ